VIRKWFLLLGFIAGCGPSGPVLVPVSGTVTFPDGRAVPGGVIEFVPTGGESARSAIGDDGTFSLKTGERDGIAPGNYRVVVVQRIPTVAHKHAGKPSSSVHPKHARADSSGLERSITAADPQLKIVVETAK
jgi:hypothetical protein